MADIRHDFPIGAPVEQVFEGMTSPGGLDEWWTLRSKGTPRLGEVYELWFGPEYDWRARVVVCETNRLFELELTKSMDDWLGTKVGFSLAPREGGTQVRFWHAGWQEASDHFRTSSFCWAMYLRVLKRYLEHGERVPYDRRLDV